MATTTIPTIKNVVFAGEDTYRKEKMIAFLLSRGMLTTESENFIRKGTR